MIVFSSAPKLTLNQNLDGHLRTEFAMHAKLPCQGQTSAEKRGGNKFPIFVCSLASREQLGIAKRADIRIEYSVSLKNDHRGRARIFSQHDKIV